MSERFWSLACQYRSMYLALLNLCFILMGLSALAYPFLETGSGSKAITQINFIILGVLATAAGFMYWRCRETREPVVVEE